MPNLRQYYLVDQTELNKVKENERPCLDYTEIYDTITKTNEEGEKLKITAWDIFEWNE
jgi:hypothetical protein